MNKDPKISNIQLLGLLVSSIVGISIFKLPNQLAGDFGPSGWLMIIISGLLIIPMLFMYERLFSMYPGMDFFQIGKELEDGINDDIYLSFLSKEDLLKSKFALTDDVIEVFSSLGKILGQSNRYDQEKNLNFIIQQINELSIQATLEENKNQKLYPSLGVLIGIGMIIILL